MSGGKSSTPVAPQPKTTNVDPGEPTGPIQRTAASVKAQQAAENPSAALLANPDDLTKQQTTNSNLLS